MPWPLHRRCRRQHQRCLHPVRRQLRIAQLDHRVQHIAPAHALTDAWHRDAGAKQCQREQHALTKHGLTGGLQIVIAGLHRKPADIQPRQLFRQIAEVAVLVVHERRSGTRAGQRLRQVRQGLQLPCSTRVADRCLRRHGAHRIATLRPLEQLRCNWQLRRTRSCQQLTQRKACARYQLAAGELSADCFANPQASFFGGGDALSERQPTTADAVALHIEGAHRPVGDDPRIAGVDVIALDDITQRIGQLADAIDRTTDDRARVAGVTAAQRIEQACTLPQRTTDQRHTAGGIF